MPTEHGVSIRRGCEAVGLPRSTYRYERRRKAGESVIEALSVLVEKHPAYSRRSETVGGGDPSPSRFSDSNGCEAYIRENKSHR